MPVTLHLVLMLLALIALGLYAVRAAISHIDLLGVGMFLWLLAIVLIKY